MKLTTLVVLALVTVVSVSAASTDFATFLPYSGSTMKFGACSTSCTTTVDFNFIGGINNLPPYDVTMHSTLTYDWAPVGNVTTYNNGLGTGYWEYVEGSFAFTYPVGGTTNLLTVDFPLSQGLLEYNPTSPTSGDLFLTLVPGIGTGIAPTMTSDIVTFAPGGLTDWSVFIDFGNQTPGYVVGGHINPFPGSGYSFNGRIGSSPVPYGQIPEPASMLMAGAGLLAVSGLLRLRKRSKK